MYILTCLPIDIHSTLPIMKSPFIKKLAIMKENLHTKYSPFTYKYVALNEKPPIMKQNHHIFFFVIGRAEFTYVHTYIFMCVGLHKYGCQYIHIYTHIHTPSMSAYIQTYSNIITLA